MQEMSEVLLRVEQTHPWHFLCVLVVTRLNQLSLLEILHLQSGNDLLGALDILLVLLRSGIVLYLLNMNVFSFDLLHLLSLQGLMLPVLVELREARPHVIDKKLRQFRVCLNNEAEELSMVVVDHLTKFFLEWERLQLFPSKVFSLEHKNSIIELKQSLGLSGHKLFCLFHQPSKDDNVIWIETEAEVVGQSCRQLNVHHCPDAQLCVVPFNVIQKLVLSR